MENETKKCPFCAEEVLKDAIICKHCKSSLTPEVKTNVAVVKKPAETDWKGIGKFLAWVIGIGFGIAFWYIAIPPVVAWYLFKKRKNKFSKKTNIIIISLVAVICIGLYSLALYSNRQPTLSVTEPQNDISLQASTINVKGSVSPSGSKISINNLPVSVDANGDFNYDAPLSDENNVINIVAENGSKSVSETLSVKRIFTPEEVAERERLQAETEAKQQAKLEAQQKAKAEADAKAKAELAAYENSKAGQLCKKNPTWTKEECQLVADKKYWIGMTYDMLITLRGKPNHANPSNYGGGTQWQWCWNDYTPSCFYDRDGDSIIDSYN